MTSAYTHTTALKIYTAIADSGDRGVDIEQLVSATKLAMNTVRTYARWLEKDGAIEIAGINSDALNRPIKNLYLALREPRVRLSDREKLQRIAVFLEPFSKHPASWDKGYKGEIVYAIQQAIRLAI